jgi:hypothetical protein
VIPVGEVVPVEKFYVLHRGNLGNGQMKEGQLQVNKG